MSEPCQLQCASWNYSTARSNVAFFLIGSYQIQFCDTMIRSSNNCRQLLWSADERSIVLGYASAKLDPSWTAHLQDAAQEVRISPWDTCTTVGELNILLPSRSTLADIDESVLPSFYDSSFSVLSIAKFISKSSLVPTRYTPTIAGARVKQQLGVYIHILAIMVMLSRTWKYRSSKKLEVSYIVPFITENDTKYIILESKTRWKKLIGGFKN